DDDADQRLGHGRSGSGGRAEATADQVVDRKRTGAAQDEVEQRAGPQQVVGVVLGVDEELDHQGHAEHGGGAEPGGEAEQQQDRGGEFDGGGERGGELGRQQ